MSDLNFVPADYAVPGDFLQINFGVGPGGSDGAVYPILIIGNKSTAMASSGATTDTVVYGPNSSPPLQNENDMIALGGTGSEAHREWLRVRKVLDKAATVGVTSPPVYVIFPTESAGTAATLTFTVAVAATGIGVLRFYLGDEFVDVGIASGQAVATIGANIAIAINNQTRWPVTASFSVATLTVTAKTKGPRGNEIRIWAKIISGTPATTITNNASTPMAGGGTADSWTTALTTILPTRYYYIVSPDTSVSGTTFDDLVAQVLSQASPITGIRQRVIAGSVDTQANASTVAANAGINTERAQIFWLQTAELTAGEIAGTAAAMLAVFESRDWSHNFRDFGLGKIRDVKTDEFWKVPAPQTQANWPTLGVAGSVNTALNNGLTPIGVTADGHTYVTWSITTRHKNGSNFDYRARSSHVVSVLDRWSDGLMAKYRERFGASKIIDDLAAGEPVPGPGVVQPQQIKALIFEEIDRVANSQFKKADLIKAGVSVQRDSVNIGRVGARIPARVIDLFLQNLVELDDISTAVA